MLSFLHTENYKNLKFDGKVDLKNLNIFIGSNGSGKSNLISYLKFLNQCLIGSSDSSRQVSAIDLAISELNRILDINVPVPSQVRLVYGFSNKEDYLNGQVLDLSFYIAQSLGGKAIINKDFLYEGLDVEENLDNPYFYYQCHEAQKKEGLLYKNIGTYFMGELKVLDDLRNNTIWLSSIVSNWQFYNSNNRPLAELDLWNSRRLFRSSKPQFKIVNSSNQIAA